MFWSVHVFRKAVSRAPARFPFNQMVAAPAAWFLSLVTSLSHGVRFSRTAADCLIVSMKGCQCSQHFLLEISSSMS